MSIATARPPRQRQDLSALEPFQPARDQMNLFSLRLRYGADLLMLFEADPGSRTIQVTASSSFTRANRREARRILATFEALKSTPFDDWRRLYQRSNIPAQPRTATLFRVEFNEFLHGRLRGDEVPYSGAIGWLGDDNLPSCFYFAGWVTDNCEIEFTLNHVAEGLLNSLKGGVARHARIVNEPLVGEHGGSITELACEGVTYQLRMELDWVFDPSANQLDLEGLSPGYVGKGGDPNVALQDVARRVHGDFQALHRTRSFDRDDQEDRRWRLLCRMIDTDAYRERTPIRRTRVGKIARASSDKLIIAWVDSLEAERVPLDGSIPFPDEFKDLKVGNWFEAVARYQPRTRQLLGIDSIQRDDSLAITDDDA